MSAFQFRHNKADQK